MIGWRETPFAKLLVDSKDGEWGAGRMRLNYVR